MINSTMMLFSVYNNIKTLVKKQKDVDIFESRYYHFNNALRNPHARNYLIDKLKKVYNDIENHYYGYHEFIIFLLYQHIWQQTASITSDITKQIQETINLFTEKQLRKDMDLIVAVFQKLDVPNPKERLFLIGKNGGESLLYKLIMSKQVSPMFFIQFYREVLTFTEKDDILPRKSNEYKRFEFIMKHIYQHLKEGLHECA